LNALVGATVAPGVADTIRTLRDNAIANGPRLQALIPRAPDVIKVILEAHTVTGTVPEVSAAVLAAIQSGASAAKVSVFAHVTDAAHLSEALDAGVPFIAHVPFYDRLSSDLVARLRSSRAVVIPTLSYTEDLAEIADGKYSQGADPALDDDVPKDILNALVGATVAPGVADTIRTLRDNAIANFRAIATASVTIAAGTDAGNPGNFHGLSLANEIALYAKNGMSWTSALRAATKNAADALGRSDLGRIEAGAIADLVAIDGDPRQDPSALHRVRFVYQNGIAIDRATLALTNDAPNVLLATPMQDRPKGATCLGADECASGLGCALDLLCRESCTDDASCGTSSLCEAEASTLRHFCYDGDGCDPFAQSCTNTDGCVFTRNGATFCEATLAAGQAGRRCGPDGECAVGFVCISTGFCRQICDPRDTTNNGGCPMGRTCVDESAAAGRPAGICM
jgi:hypothetical protein